MKAPQAPRWIVVLQYASVAGIWIFVFGISIWIIHLIDLSSHLHDVPSASIGISIVAIPVFLTGASVLTYVFFGLQHNQAPDEEGQREESPS